MPKRKRFDEESEKNRNRVNLCRFRKKIKSHYHNTVQERINLISEQQAGIHGFKKIDNHQDDITEKLPEKDSCFDATEFKDRLRLWASNHNVSGEAINGLLTILIWAGFSFLPKDCRTLKKNPPKVSIDILTNGKLFYYGLKKCLIHVLTTAHEHIDSITLNFNFDGLPISKSSASQFWPILASVKGKPFNFILNYNFMSCHDRIQ